LVVGFAAPVGVTVLGWMATTEIRGSGGRVWGLGLAFGEMVLFPLLALDAWLLWLCSQTGLNVLVGAVAALAADTALILWLWGRVQKTLPPAQRGAGGLADDIAARGSLAAQLWRVARRAGLVVVVQLLLLETLLQLSVGWRESTEELWTMGLYSACLAAIVWAAWPLQRRPWTPLIRAGVALVLFIGLSVTGCFYSWHLRPNLGLYREPGWVAQHPGFQRGLQARIEKNLWRKGGATLAQTPGFGPVTERVLYSVATQRPIKAEDFDAGREMEVPAEIEKAGEEQFFHWLAAQGADLLALGHEQSWDLWVSATLASAPAAIWDQPAATGLLLKAGPVGLERAEPDAKEGFVSYRLETNAVFPLTFAVQTRAGGFGVLQVTGFTESPRGVKIRYRLQKPGGMNQALSLDRQEDFVAQHRAELGQKALDGARDFVEEHQWKMQSEWGDHQRVVFKATDRAGKNITFEETIQTNGMARFTINTAPGTELPAQRIGAAIWRRLGWAEPSVFAPARTITPPEFGPAITRELGTDWGALDCTVLDLEQGRLLSVLTNIVAASMNNRRPMLNWMVEHGADLTVTAGAGVDAHLHLDGGVLLRLEATFGSVAASTVRRDIGSGGGAQDVSIPRAEVETQPVFLYRTREGGMGVLQVLGLSQDPLNLRIRFKAVLSLE
jgi:hypothetical protein